MYRAQVRMASIPLAVGQRLRKEAKAILNVALPSRYQVKLQRLAAQCRRVKSARLQSESAVKNKE